MSEATQIVAIDGPAGAGKSSAARRVAQTLNFSFLDTGAMYRAATWWAREQGVDLDDCQALAESTRAMQLQMHETGRGQQVIVNGNDITAAIRTPEITKVIYKLDQNSGVRKHLVDVQREIGALRPTVAEGRDIGTVVFPKAKCKIYLDASLDERTRRRMRQLAGQAMEADFDALRAEIHARDEKTKNRADSPLRQAEDAVLFDTTDLDFEEVVAELVRIARKVL